MGLKLNFGAALKSQKTESDDAVSRTKHRVLLVDDEEPNLRVTERYLSTFYKVDTALSGHEALERIKALGPGEEYAAIVTDHVMPKMTGIELCVELNQQGHRAPRIILTGFAELNSVIAGINDGNIFGYLTKPVEKSTLLSTVARATSHYDAREETRRLTRMAEELQKQHDGLIDIIERENLARLKADARGKQSPQKLNLAVVFADIIGFDGLPTLSATRLMNTLQSLIEPLHDTVYEFNGIIDKHIGRGLMAVFGFEGDGVSQCSGAVAKMVDQFPDLISKLGPEFSELTLAIGASEGEVIFGSLGSAQKSELAIIGDTANFAARLREFSTSVLTKADFNPAEHKGNRACAFISPSLLATSEVFESVTLTEAFQVRDFPDIKNLGTRSA